MSVNNGQWCRKISLWKNQIHQWRRSLSDIVLQIGAPQSIMRFVGFNITGVTTRLSRFISWYVCWFASLVRTAKLVNITAVTISRLMLDITRTCWVGPMFTKPGGFPQWKTQRRHASGDLYLYHGPQCEAGHVGIRWYLTLGHVIWEEQHGWRSINKLW